MTNVDNLGMWQYLLLMAERLTEVKERPSIQAKADGGTASFLSCWRQHVLSEAWRVTAGVVVHWKVLHWKSTWNALETHCVICNHRTYANTTRPPGGNSNTSECTVWFIGIDPDCVKQAVHKRKLFPLFVGDVWTGPQQQGASFHRHLIPLFSHMHTNKVFVTL